MLERGLGFGAHGFQRRDLQRRFRIYRGFLTGSLSLPFLKGSSRGLGYRGFLAGSLSLSFLRDLQGVLGFRVSFRARSGFLARLLGGLSGCDSLGFEGLGFRV